MEKFSVGEILHNRWKIKKLLGTGGFGAVYKVYDSKLCYDIAIKLSSKKGIDHLKKERLLLKVLNYEYPKTFSYCYFYRSLPNLNISVLGMDLLGVSLRNLIYNNKLPKIRHISVEMLNMLKKLHQIGYIHGDIKPKNWMVGLADKKRPYLIDFGLSTRYVDNENRHIKLDIDRFSGTRAYASINAHKKLKLSRRDDLISFAYMLIDIYKPLPWNDKEGTYSHNLKATYFKKMQFNILSFADHTIPKELVKFYNNVTHLSFTECPDYKLLFNLLRQINIEPKIERE